METPASVEQFEKETEKMFVISVNLSSLMEECPMSHMAKHHADLMERNAEKETGFWKKTP